MRLFILILVALSACVANEIPDGPTVRIAYTDAVSESDRAYLRSATIPWQSLGFAFEEWALDDALEHPDPNAIGILIDRESGTHAGRASASTGEIWIDNSTTGLAVYRIGAHELGHVLLSTSAHVEHGMMQTYPLGYANTQLSRDDLDLACRRIAVCL